MNRFTVAQNIARFEKILATSTDAGLIRIVEQLLKFERRWLGQADPAAVAPIRETHAVSDSPRS